MVEARSLDAHHPPRPWVPFWSAPRKPLAQPDEHDHRARQPSRSISSKLDLACHHSPIHIEDLTPLQLRLLEDHHADLMRAAKHPDPHLRLARASPSYALARFIVSVLTLCVKSALTNPMAPLTDPVNWACSVLAYVALFGMLSIMHISFIFGALVIRLCVSEAALLTVRIRKPPRCAETHTIH